MPDGFHLWHFTSNKTYYTVWMSTTRKKQGAFNTLPPVSRGRWRQVQGGVFIPPTRRRALTLARPDTDVSNASDGISFVYARSRTHFKRRDEATVCWWMRLSPPSLKQAHISLHRVAENRVGGRKREKKKKGREADEEEGERGRKWGWNGEEGGEEMQKKVLWGEEERREGRYLLGKYAGMLLRLCLCRGSPSWCLLQGCVRVRTVASWSALQHRKTRVSTWNVFQFRHICLAYYHASC